MKAMHVRSSVSCTIISSLGVCVCRTMRLATNRVQTVFFFFFASHAATNWMHTRIHGLKTFHHSTE